MNTLKKIKTTLMVAIALTVGSCSLDVVDPSSLSPENALNDLTGYSNLVNSLYRRVSEFSYYGQTMMIGPEILADNLELIQNTGRYTTDYVNGVGTLLNIWNPGSVAQFNSLYTAINEANWVIGTIDEQISNIDTIGQFGVRERLKGEAYFNRALRYFDLLRVYAYEPGQEVNGFNLGVILRTEPIRAATDANFRARSTNLEGYQLVEADLIQAIQLLPEPGQTGSYPLKASKQAARALLAKVYLYMGRFGDASTQADLALAYANGALRTSANYLAAWSATPHGESFFEADVRSSDWNSVDGANNSLQSLTQNTLGGAQYIVAASDELIAAHPAGDVRLQLYVKTAATLNKNQSRKWNGEKGTFVENIPIIRRSDVLLISAEAKARAGDEAGALTLVNLLRTNRGLSSVTLSGTALIDEILLQRRLEFALEGSRWFDLKRLGKDITKPAVSAANTVLYEDHRILQRIPISETTINSNLIQNPNY